MDNLIKQIETDFPELRWLVRSIDETEPMFTEHGVKYFAHICNADYSRSYRGESGHSANDALLIAYNFAKAAS